jgi:hypothetical protein
VFKRKEGRHVNWLEDSEMLPVVAIVKVCIAAHRTIISNTSCDRGLIESRITNFKRYGIMSVIPFPEAGGIDKGIWFETDSVAPEIPIDLRNDW